MSKFYTTHEFILLPKFSKKLYVELSYDNYILLPSDPIDFIFVKTFDLSDRLIDENLTYIICKTIKEELRDEKVTSIGYPSCFLDTEICYEHIKKFPYLKSSSTPKYTNIRLHIHIPCSRFSTQL